MIHCAPKAVLINTVIEDNIICIVKLNGLSRELRGLKATAIIFITVFCS